MPVTHQRPGRLGGGLREPSIEPLLQSLHQTLEAFVEIGLGYLSLERPTGTLSGGDPNASR